MMFSDIVLDHFQTPRNVGEMDNADAQAFVENPVCGDRLQLWITVRDGRIGAASWRADGCAAAIAAASVTSELVRGMELSEAGALQRETVIEALGGLPARKAHAAALAVAAVRTAVQTYDGREHDEERE
jgi:nitrogen fixation protein NifU and related proteins